MQPYIAVGGFTIKASREPLIFAPEFQVQMQNDMARYSNEEKVREYNINKAIASGNSEQIYKMFNEGYIGSIFPSK